MERASDILEQIRGALDGSGQAEVCGELGNLAAYVLPELGARPERGMLWVTATEADAQQRYTALRAAMSDPGTHQRSKGHRRVAHYPDWDVEPYSGLSPHAAITRRRLEVLGAWTDGHPWVVVISAPALVKRVLPKASLEGAREWVVQGAACPREPLIQRLAAGGYLRVDRVEDRGTFAVRGQVVDLYPPDSGLPVRIEQWGDEVESIRTFDPATQRSVERLEDLIILPVSEFLLTAAALERSSQTLADLADERGIRAQVRVDLARSLRRGYSFAGREDYLPLLHPELDSLLSYLPESALVVLEDTERCASAITNRYQTAEKCYVEYARFFDLVPEPASLQAKPDQLLRELESHPRVLLGADTGVASLGAASAGLRTLRDQLLAESRRPEGSLTPLVELLQEQAKSTRVVLARTDTSLRRLAELLEARDIPVLTHPYRPRPTDLLDPQSPIRRGPSHVHLAVGSPGHGFLWPEGELLVIAEEDIFGQRTRARRHSGGSGISSPADLRDGDTVVHALHGIGRFLGLRRIEAGGTESDVLVLEYRGADRLYVPIHRIDLVRRHGGPTQDDAQLDRMGGQSFAKKRKKATESIQRMALELLEIQARRSRARSRPYSEPGPALKELEASFPFEETTHQLKAIHDTLADMATPTPMDRLLCGEVGFGKTEVAIRAAYQAVLDGRQVAFLAPTTVLAMQHARTLAARLGPFGVEIALLSRLRTPAEQRETLGLLSQGRVDVVIGTQRLLQPDVDFADLGLLIVDEEHRFGVKDKERIKRMRAGIDILSMTATPIPRTLNMALSGLRDLSILETPPPGRQAIRTFVAPFAVDRIRRAIDFELKRGGQIFFVHNRIQSIASMEHLLRRLLPDVEIQVAHGQLPPRELERIMVAFMEGRFRILLSTTIIESGIDIPTANTLIVNRADRYGLAELHQLRGRVGRGADRGYCYLLTPPSARLSEEARRRLQVLQDNQHLGAGLRIAYEDLEIRGAGTLLGKAQSGHVQAVGIETYLDMVRQEVGRLEGRASLPPLEVDVDLGAWIPATWLPDPAERLLAYRQLVTCDDPSTSSSIVEELEDLWGPPPDEVHRFVALARMRSLARSTLVSTIRRVGATLQVSFYPNTPIDPADLEKAEDLDFQPTWKPDGVLSLRPGEAPFLESLESALRALASGATLSRPRG